MVLEEKGLEQSRSHCLQLHRAREDSTIFSSFTFCLCFQYYFTCLFLSYVAYRLRSNRLVEFRRVSIGMRWIYVENNATVKVKGIDTYKLVLCGGRTLILHDILFTLEI